MLLLGSHDTARIKTMLGADGALLRAAFGLLLTYPGAPCIYYGDEIGLEAGGSSGGTGTFPWDGGWDEDLLTFVRMTDRGASPSAGPAVRRFPGPRSWA